MALYVVGGKADGFYSDESGVYPNGRTQRISDIEDYQSDCVNENKVN